MPTLIIALSPHIKSPRTLYGSRGVIANARAVRRGNNYSPRTHRLPSGPIQVGRRVRRRSVDKLSNKLFIVALMIYFIGILVKQPSADFPGRRDVSCYTSYAVPHTNAVSPAAAWYFPFYQCFVFALAERKNET